MSPISRRRLLTRAGLAGAGVLGAAGIGSAVAVLTDLPARPATATPTGSAAPSSSAPAAAPELVDALARERTLVTAATAAQQADPSHPALASVIADHQAHADALAALIGPGAFGSTPAPAPAAQTVATVVAAEQAAATAATTAAGTVHGAGAVLLASIAACEAGHVELLA